MGEYTAIKRFLEWIKLKEKLHNVQSGAPIVKERDLWWVSLGENIGSEVNGKSELFSRPGVIIKKLSRGFYLIAPTTSQKKKEHGMFLLSKRAKRCLFACTRLELLIIEDYLPGWVR